MADDNTRAANPTGFNTSNLLILAMLTILIVLAAGSFFLLVQRDGDGQGQRVAELEQRVAELEDQVERIDSLDEDLAALKSSFEDKSRSQQELQSSIRKGIESYVAERSGQGQGQQQGQANRQSQSQGAQTTSVSLDDTDAIRGNADAAVSIIEYSDYECPYCKRMHRSGTVEQVVDASGGQVNATLRHFPLSMHGEIAKQEAIMAECVQMEAGDEAFWAVTDAIFQRTAGGGKGVSKPLDEFAADTTDVSASAIRSCVQEGEAKRRVRSDIQDGREKGVKSTPSLIVYNHETDQARPMRGAVGADRLRRAIQAVSP
jgi:protein-disulfide isomerase